MIPNWILCSKDEELCKYWKKYFKSDDQKNVFIYEGDIRAVRTSGVTAYICFTSSMGLLDSHINRVYKYMFPTLQHQLNSAIMTTGFKTKYGHPFLPVGSAFLIQVSPTAYVVCCPYMLLPQDISKTNNVMVCLRLVIELLNKFSIKNPDKIQNVIIPGIKKGEILPQQCAKDMFAAWSTSVNVDTLQDNPIFAYNPSIIYTQPQTSTNHPFIK